jgi:CPA1 family monovalent cation:H+ antiporter
LSFIVTAANVNDITMLNAVLEAMLHLSSGCFMPRGCPLAPVMSLAHSARIDATTRTHTSRMSSNGCPHIRPTLSTTCCRIADWPEGRFADQSHSPIRRLAFLHNGKCELPTLPSCWPLSTLASICLLERFRARRIAAPYMFDIAVLILVITALLAYLNQRFLKLPMTIGVMASSLVLSLVLVGLDALGLAGSLHLREQQLLASINFSTVLMQGMLSLLLFAGALHVDLSQLRSYRWQVGLLAFVGTALSTILVAALLWWLLPWIGLPLPLIDCLLFGALISPTDPIAVIGMLKSASAPANLEVVIAGESLFNDGVGVVIFTLLLGIAIQGGSPTIGQASMLLLQQAGGGLAFGTALGFGLHYLLRTVDHYQVKVMLTLAAVLGGYTVANHLDVSGPLAMVVTGLVIGNDGRTEALSDVTRHHVDLFWELLDEILNAVLFVLVGLEVITIHFPVSAGYACAAGAAVIVATLFARWLTVGVPFLVFGKAMRLPNGSAGILTWGGLRGGISIALALAIPPGHNSQTLVALTYCVVAFSILVQGLTFGRLVKRWLV